MNKSIIFLVGPTGSGKTNLALQIARKYNGEIICADSRTIYRGLDIGTAKPTPEERAEILHWGLDIISADEAFSAHKFKVLAQEAIEDIHRRNKLPIVTGGTGLYIDTLLYDMQLGPEADPEKRRLLSQLSIDELQRIITVKGWRMPQNVLNKRHLIRTIELAGEKTGRSERKMDHAIVVGITTKKEILLARLRQRAEVMFRNPALYSEARAAASTYGWDAPGLSGNIYRLVKQVEDDSLTIEEAIDKFVTLDWQLAKRQLTWFRRSPDIVWLELDQIMDYVGTQLR